MIARLSCLCSFHNSKIFTCFISPTVGVFSVDRTRVLTCAFLLSSVSVIVAATWTKLPCTRSLRRIMKNSARWISICFIDD